MIKGRSREGAGLRVALAVVAVMALAGLATAPFFGRVEQTGGLRHKTRLTKPAESVLWAARFCDRIFIWDLGSEDRTVEVLRSLPAEKVQVELKPGMLYRSALRGEIANQVRGELGEEDWIYILDADEFLVGDPAAVLQRARQQGVHLVGAWQANFYPTEETLRHLDGRGEEEWSRIPLATRLRHYRLEWFEWRFIRMSAQLQWITGGQYSVFRLTCGASPRHGRQAMVVRHYRYRSPAQVRLRYRTRREAAAVGRPRFRYENTPQFRELVRPARSLVRWPDDQPELVVPRAEFRRARIRLLCWRASRKIARWREQLRERPAGGGGC